MKILSRFSLHLIAIFLVSNFLISRAIRYYIRANTCISQSEWQQLATDPNHCYVIYVKDRVTQVFEPQLMSIGPVRTHKGNEICGTDVTAIIPSSHISDPVKYLTDTLRGELKPSCAPPATPSPQPTSIPKKSPVDSPLILVTTILDYIGLSVLVLTLLLWLIRGIWLRRPSPAPRPRPEPHPPASSPPDSKPTSV